MQPGRAGTASSDMVVCIVTPASCAPPPPFSIKHGVGGRGGVAWERLAGVMTHAAMSCDVVRSVSHNINTIAQAAPYSE